MNSFIFLFIMSMPSSAPVQTCPNALIEAGTKASCTGYLISPKVAAESYRDSEKLKLVQEELDFSKLKVESFQQEVSLLKEDVKQMSGTIKENSALHDAYVKTTNLQIGLTAGGVALGVTVLAVCLAYAFGGANSLAAKLVSK